MPEFKSSSRQILEEEARPEGGVLSTGSAKGEEGLKSDTQRNALLSWLRLEHEPSIFLVGNHSSFHDLAREFPGRVHVEPEVDTNLYGVPLVNSLLGRAVAARTNLSMVVYADTVLLNNDFASAVRKAAANFGDFVLVGIRWDIVRLPEGITAVEALVSRAAAGDVDGAGAGAGASAATLAAVAEEEEGVRQILTRHGRLRTRKSADYWVWNNNSPSVPLTRTPVPPFALGRGWYDGWLTDAMIGAGAREVVDVSLAVFAIHVPHRHPPQVRPGLDLAEASGRDERRALWNMRPVAAWEELANGVLAAAAGANGTGGTCLVKRERAGTCMCEHSPYASSTQTDPAPQGKYYLCGRVPKRAALQEEDLPAAASADSKPGMPHRLEDLLPLVASPRRDVIMVGVSGTYSSMLMSFLCRLRQLGFPDVLVAALDEDLYRFAYPQGLPVYYDSAADAIRGVNTTKCNYFTACFKQLTKVKSRAVLRVLKLGYNVLWTDVDIVWFRDPFPELLAFGPGVLPIQSNAPNVTNEANEWQGINSGFYYARAEPLVVEAFEAIIAHAAKSKESEQPSFYRVLCGENMERRRGSDECVWTNGLRVAFLDRHLHPNGKIFGHWEKPDVARACVEDGCASLHNNWIVGKKDKVDRLVRNGFWYYDAELRMCRYSWFDGYKEAVRPAPS
eukprot:jgi/Mesen1/10308/ME000079S09733